MSACNGPAHILSCRVPAAGIFIVHVRVAFREGHPEINERNKMFKNVKANKVTPHTGISTAVQGITRMDTCAPQDTFANPSRGFDISCLCATAID